MRKLLFILLISLSTTHLCAIKVDYRLSGRSAWIMPDGKVDEVVDNKGAWIGPAWSIDFSATFHPQWQSLRHWNGAGIGVGFSYWNLPHRLLGQAFAPYTYMDIPLFKSKHFVLGLRPGIGVGFMTKTYLNTVAEENKFVSVVDANECIGSVTNLYFPEMIYLDFPIAKGWSMGIAGGWYHFSNGSIRQPNSGYNLFAGELSLKYSPPPVAVQRNAISHNRSTKTEKNWSICAGATAGGRQVYYRDQQTFFVASMHMAAYWHACPIFRLGGGVDAFYDGAYIQRSTHFKKTNLEAAQAGDCWRIGVSVQPEFMVGNFTAGIHIGAYLYDPVKELEPYNQAIKSPTGRIDKPIFYSYDLLKAGSAGNPDGWIYTEVVLRYHLPFHLFVQAMMKSHLTKVEFVSIGLGVYY